MTRFIKGQSISFFIHLQQKITKLKDRDKVRFMSEVELLRKIAEDVAVLREKVDSMEALLIEAIYPDEDLISPEFIKKVEEAEERIKIGEGLKFSSMEEFLKSVEE